ncbi:MAG: 2'-5' RNA ligase family protein [Aliidongia sp.]
MTTFEVAAAPIFDKADHDRLVQMRRLGADNRGPPHFTLVFPGTELSGSDFTRHVTAAVRGIKRIKFVLRSAVVAPDPQVRAYHVFLVPDEGFGAIVRLYERLHAGALQSSLRTDLSYIPHLTVASERDPAAARRIAVALNAENFAMAGRIDELEILRLDGEVIRRVATVPLASAGLFG